MGQKDASPWGPGFGLFFLLPRGFLGYPVFLTHCHLSKALPLNLWGVILLFTFLVTSSIASIALVLRSGDFAFTSGDFLDLLHFGPYYS